MEALLAGARSTSPLPQTSRIIPSMFVVVTHGLPYAVTEMPPSIKRLRRHEIILRTWEDECVFDCESHFRYVASTVPTISSFQRFLAKTIYDPVVPFTAELQRISDFRQKDLVAAVKKGLDRDEDIIQQWFEGTDVIKLLTRASNWNEILIAVDAIGGGHEDSVDVAAYVNRVLKRKG